MRIALISDIHANLPALEACFADLDQRKPDMVYCLGDLVGYHVWPNEVINLIREKKIATIRGNYDFGIGQNSNDCGCAYKTDDEKKNGAVSISLTNQWIGGEERKFLHELPSHIRIEFDTENIKKNLLLVHGSPRRVNEYLFEDREESSMIRIIQDAHADILCFGHTHKPFHRVMQSETTTLHAINTGSVGKPKDGDNSGSYAILEIDDWLKDPARLGVHIIRFDYDVEYSANALAESGLPLAYAASLRTGT